jgi:hypothetical protein
MSDEEEVKQVLQEIEREKRKWRPDKGKLRYLHRELAYLKGDGWNVGQGYQGPNQHTSTATMKRKAGDQLDKRPHLWKEPQPPRPPHNKDDEGRLEAFYRSSVEDVPEFDAFVSGRAWDAFDILLDCAGMIQWARKGRFAHTQALRLGIIAGVPVLDLAREFGGNPERIYKLRREYMLRTMWRRRKRLRPNSRRKGDAADPVLLQYRQMIQWARDGQARSQALRLGIIAGVPAADLAREFKKKTQGIYRQVEKYYRKMGGRPIITAALAHPDRGGWRARRLLAACNPGIQLLRE